MWRAANVPVSGAAPWWSFLGWVGKTVGRFALNDSQQVQACGENHLVKFQVG